MATATKNYTSGELYNVLKLAKVHTVDFEQADIPVDALTALGQGYLDLVLAKTTAFPFGRALQQFADAQIPLIKQAIIDAQ